MNIITKNLDAGKVSGGFGTSNLYQGIKPPSKSISHKRGVTTEADSYRRRREIKLAIAQRIRELGTLNPEAEMLERCGSAFTVDMSKMCGKVKSKFPNYRCGLTFCPDCNLRERGKQVRKLLPKFRDVLTRNPKLKPYFLTLTLQRSSSLSSAKQFLKKSFLKLRRQKFLASVAGGYCWVESVTKSDGHHVHLHGIILAPASPSKNHIASAWCDLTHGSYAVDIRPINVNELDAVLGYAYKPIELTNMSKKQTQEILDLDRSKMHWSFGEVHKSKAEPEAVEPEYNIGDKCDCGDPECVIVRRVLPFDALMTLLEFQDESAFPSPRAKHRYVH